MGWWQKLPSSKPFAPLKSINGWANKGSCKLTSASQMDGLKNLLETEQSAKKGSTCPFKGVLHVEKAFQTC